MKLQIETSLQINKPSHEIFKIISDIKQWNTWSPWNHDEPTCKTECTGHAGSVGQYQVWDGEVVGSGKMTIKKLDSNRSVGMELEFYKPWKSVAEVTFTMRDVKPSVCEVTWKMDGKMPIFMIFFKKMMIGHMKYDFDRGLKMLKEYAETGAVVSKATYKGEVNLSGFQVIGKKTTCKISDLSSAMQTDFTQIGETMKKGQLSTPEMMLALYHKFDIPNNICEYTAGLAYKTGESLTVPAGMHADVFADHKALLVDYYGPYRNLANPWSMIAGYQRGKKKKALKKVPMYEIYKTMPDGRPEKDIHTQVVMPIK